MLFFIDKTNSYRFNFGDFLQFAHCGHSYTVIGEGLLEGYKISCQQFCEFQIYNLALGSFEKT